MASKPPTADAESTLAAFTPVQQEWARHSVFEVLMPTSQGNTIPADADAVQVLSRMQQSGNSRLMVVESGQLVGVIVLKDLLAFLALKLDLEGKE